MPHVSKAKLAELLGVSRPYISKLVSKGVIPIDADGQIDYDTAILALKDIASPGPQLRHASPADTPPMQEIRASALEANPDAEGDAPATATSLDDQGIPKNYQQARALRERFAAMNERLKFERDISYLVDADGVGKGIQDILATLRAHLDLVPGRAIADLPVEIGHPIRLKIAAELEAALTTAREQLQKLLEPPPVQHKDNASENFNAFSDIH